MNRLALVALLLLGACASAPPVATLGWVPAGSAPDAALRDAFPRGLVLDAAGRERAQLLAKEARVRSTLHHDNERRWESAAGASVLVWDLDDPRQSVNDVRFRRLEVRSGEAAVRASAEREASRLWAELERHLLEALGSTDEQ